MMNDASRQDRIRPSLLDRLTDDAPDQKVEGRDRRGSSAQRLKECVLRDIGWLMNCTALETTDDLSNYPLVQASVVNFGIPEFSGLLLATMEIEDLEEQVRQALLRFEPRIMPETMKVTCRIDRERMSVHSLGFDVQADLRADPVPLPLFLRTQIDVEAGDVLVTEGTR